MVGTVLKVNVIRVNMNSTSQMHHVYGIGKLSIMFHSLPRACLG